MTKKMVFSKLIYFAVALALLASMVMVGCGGGGPAEPTPPEGPMTQAPTTPTAPAEPTTPVTAPEEPGLQPVYGGTLRTSNPAGPYQICYPAAMYSTHDYKPYCASVDPLFKMDYGMNLIPCLAEGYSSDYAAKTCTVNIRKGVKFHDGTEFNAEVAKWNLEEHKRFEKSGTPYIGSIDVIDDYTIRINLTDWDSTFFTGLGGQEMSGVYSKAAFEENGEDWCLKNCVAAGPFVLDSWEREVSRSNAESGQVDD